MSTRKERLASGAELEENRINRRKLGKIGGSVAAIAIVAASFGVGTQVDSFVGDSSQEIVTETVDEKVEQIFNGILILRDKYASEATLWAGDLVWVQEENEIYPGFEFQRFGPNDNRNQLVAEFRSEGNTREDNVVLGLTLSESTQGVWEIKQSVFVDNIEREALRTVTLVSSPDQLEPFDRMLDQIEDYYGSN